MQRLQNRWPDRLDCFFTRPLARSLTLKNNSSLHTVMGNSDTGPILKQPTNSVSRERQYKALSATLPVVLHSFDVLRAAKSKHTSRFRGASFDGSRSARSVKSDKIFCSKQEVVELCQWTTCVLAHQENAHL